MAASDFAAHVTKGDTGDSAVVEEYVPSQVAGETCVVGEMVVWDGANDWVERAAADPTAIVGICEVDSEQARVLTTNGKIPIRTLTSDVVLCFSSATDYSEATHRGNEYGITRSSAGNWRIDTSKTGGSARVVITDGELSPINRFYGKVLAEYLANDGIDS